FMMLYFTSLRLLLFLSPAPSPSQIHTLSLHDALPIYNADPKKDANAVKFDELTHVEVIKRGLKIMDATASTLSMDNDIDLVVFNMNEPGNIKRVVFGEAIGTTVSNKADHHNH